MKQLAKICVCLAFFLCANVYSQLELTKGIIVNDQSIGKLSRNSIPYGLAFCGWLTSCPPNTSTPNAFIEFDTAGQYFALKRNMTLVSFNLNSPDSFTSMNLGSANPCGDTFYCAVPWWNGRWNGDELLEQVIIDHYPNGMAWSTSLRPPMNIMGCMEENAPLRYGDINGDGESELIVFVKNYFSIDWVVFSPQLGKTIFAVKLDHNDILSNSEARDDLLYAIPESERYQYWSKYWSETGVSRAMSKGYNSFAKLYFNDFDQDGKFDILVWRKLYQSHLVSDPQIGFQLIKETFGHYELNNGEYSLQTTDSSTIESWLAESQLTWQSGYPNKSECLGQEDQLIPEMHDPILNDPEVLQ